MTNTQYGNYQTPSSRPPEPPYRTGYQESANAIPQTEDTSRIASEQPVSEPDLRGFDAATATTSTAEAETSVPDGYEGMHRGDTQSMPRQTYAEGAHAQASGIPAGAAGSYNSTVRAAQPVQKSNAGKTFIFGFLGALVACAIAFGGFMLWNNGNTSSAANAQLGSTNSTTINAADEGQTLAEAVAAKALPSVVAVYNYQEQASSYGYGYGYNTSTNGDLTASGMGSGVAISDEGYILTNYHVVEDADKITVKVGDDERDATYVGGDASSDVAVLKIDNTEGLTAADIGNSDELVIGEWVMTIGAPLGLEQSVATGVVSATNRSTIMDSSSSDSTSYFYQNTTPEYTYYPNMIQTDAVINPGNSGGALVDSDGKLIGINTMISSYSGDYAGVGFAIPVNYAMGLAEQIIDGKTPTHAILGVTISSVNSNIAQRYNLSTDSGAYVSTIAEGTGAADSDLQVGDIITKVDDSAISSTTDVTLEVREHNPGDTVTVTVNRGGETLDIPITLSSDENMNTSSSSNDSKNQNNQDSQGQGQGRGNGYGYGYGNGNGYDSDQLEELLKMLGM